MTHTIRCAVFAAGLIVALLWILPAGPVSAGRTCCDMSGFPAVSSLKLQGDGLRIVLGSKWAKSGKPTRPAMLYDPVEGWTLEIDAPPVDHWEPSACKVLVPPIHLTLGEAILLRPDIGYPCDNDSDRVCFSWSNQVLERDISLEQSIGACHQTGNVIWFGISFYEGEGSVAVGGIGRYDLKTKQLKIRRPKELRDVSVNHLAYDGKTVWLTTHLSSEYGYYPALGGLISYDWEDRILYAFWRASIKK